MSNNFLLCFIIARNRRLKKQSMINIDLSTFDELQDHRFTLSTSGANQLPLERNYILTVYEPV